MGTETESKKTRKPLALTAKIIEALKPDPTGAYRVPDMRCKGLTLRVGRDGGKTWGVAYRIKGEGVRRPSLGRYEDVSIEAAREKANALTSAARQGRDLIAEEEAARNEYDQSFTVERLIAEYAKRRLNGRLKTANVIERRIRRALASVMERKATDIRRRDLRQIFDAVADKGHKAAAEKQRSMVQAMFRWALRQDIVEIDPSAGLSVYGQPVARERVLDPNEIRELWPWLGTGDMPAHIADILKLQLCLGARVGEVCGMTAEELEHDGSDRLLWNLPAARSKNGSGRITPIVGLALEILEPRLKTATMADCLCPRAEHPRLAASWEWRSSHAAARTPIAHFSSHDLRRTVATEMAKLGLPLDLVATVLGHEAGGGSETRTLRKHYVHDHFVDRKATALAKWDRRLRAILTRLHPQQAV